MARPGAPRASMDRKAIDPPGERGGESAAGKACSRDKRIVINQVVSTACFSTRRPLVVVRSGGVVRPQWMVVPGARARAIPRVEDGRPVGARRIRPCRASTWPAAIPRSGMGLDQGELAGPVGDGVEPHLVVGVITVVVVSTTRPISRTRWPARRRAGRLARRRPPARSLISKSMPTTRLMVRAPPRAWALET